jgi:hypothetical protein
VTLSFNTAERAARSRGQPRNSLRNRRAWSSPDRAFRMRRVQETASDERRRGGSVCGDALKDYRGGREATRENFVFGFKVPEDVRVETWPTHARYGKRAGLANEHFLDAKALDQFFTSRLKRYRSRVGPRLIGSPRTCAIRRAQAMRLPMPRGTGCQFVAKSPTGRSHPLDDLECPLRRPSPRLAHLHSFPPARGLPVVAAPKSAGFPRLARAQIVGSAKGAAAPRQRRARPRSRSGEPPAHKPTQCTRCRRTRDHFGAGPRSLAQ